MRLKSNVTNVILFMGISLLSACENDDSNRLSANLSVEATASQLSAPESKQGRIVISNFQINMKEVEFEFDKSDPRSTSDVSVKDVKLKGPFILNLLNPSGSLNALLAIVELPNAVYENVTFKTHKGTSGIMLDKAVLMTGTIDGKPFEFWHDMDEKLEVDFTDKNQDLVIDGNDKSLIIDYKLNSLLAAASGIDLTTAKDGNNNGKIEINPKDADGNQQLAKTLRDNLRDAIKLIDKK
jgi:hypothetical protein